VLDRFLDGCGFGNPPRLDRVAPALSFSMNPRAFMKKYARDLSGDRKFTLFVSRLAKGSASTEVPPLPRRTTFRGGLN